MAEENIDPRLLTVNSGGIIVFDPDFEAEFEPILDTQKQVPRRLSEISDISTDPIELPEIHESTPTVHEDCSDAFLPRCSIVRVQYTCGHIVAETRRRNDCERCLQLMDKDAMYFCHAELDETDIEMNDDPKGCNCCIVKMATVKLECFRNRQRTTCGQITPRWLCGHIGATEVVTNESCCHCKGTGFLSTGRRRRCGAGTTSTYARPIPWRDEFLVGERCADCQRRNVPFREIPPVINSYGPICTATISLHECAVIKNANGEDKVVKHYGEQETFRVDECVKCKFYERPCCPFVLEIPAEPGNRCVYCLAADKRYEEDEVAARERTDSLARLMNQGRRNSSRTDNPQDAILTDKERLTRLRSLERYHRDAEKRRADPEVHAAYKEKRRVIEKARRDRNRAARLSAQVQTEVMAQDDYDDYFNGEIQEE